MATPALTHGNRICSQCISLGPFTGSRKNGGLTSGSKAAAVVRTCAVSEPSKIPKLNSILQTEYKHRGFLVVGNKEVIIPFGDKSIFAVGRGRKEKAILSMEQ